MLGVIVGDIVGSRFEFNNHCSKEFALFTSENFVTDDTIMSLAVAKAMMEAVKAKGMPSSQDDGKFHILLSNLTTRYMQELGRNYPDCGFGGMFYQWVFSDNPEPYNSYGNGAAMRVSAAGFTGRTKKEAIQLAETVTAVTHNHDEGIKGATATAVAIYMARMGALKGEIRQQIIANYYPLKFRIDDIRQTYTFNETCQGTVPQAITCFLESNSFEEAIRIAISLGGDSDTIAAITGSIAEAYYGVPDAIKEKALSYLDRKQRTIYDEWTAFKPASERLKVLTKYIRIFESTESFGQWIVDQKGEGTLENPIHWTFVDYSDYVNTFVQEFYGFSAAHPEYGLTRYAEILEECGIPWGWGSREMHQADVSGFDKQSVLALIMGAIRADRFAEGALLKFFEDGSMARWLRRLKEIM
jgi:ADP-ribosyl-[dinitrogen reductase] hydrolase